MISLALYWLTVKSRGRALRVLAGVSPRRIQYEDIAAFLVPLSVTGTAALALATGFIGIANGWSFAVYYGQTLALFTGLVILTTAACMLLICLTAWPSPRLLARREAAVSKYRTPSAALKAVTFILLLSSVAPSVTAYQHANDVAAQQSVWRSLADQVSLALPSAVDEDHFQELSSRIGEVIADAESQRRLALSYTWTADPDAGRSFGPEQNLSLVNQQWLDLVTTSSSGDQILPTPMAAEELPPGIRDYLQANLPIWLRSPTVPAAKALRQFTFYQLSGSGEVAMIKAGGGGMAFIDSGVVMVTPRVHDMFTDDFLGSTASSTNLMFTGLGPTQQLLEEHQLTGKLYVKLVAEEGVLLAQLTAYFAWLRGLSAITLAVALLISAAIAAFITATVQGRRNFPLRLAGRSWTQILSGAIVREWAIGVVLSALVLAVQQFQLAPAVMVAAIGCLAISTVISYRAAQWSFNLVTARSM